MSINESHRNVSAGPWPEGRGVPPATTGPEALEEPAPVESPVSPWLYIAGMLVTLSGLYAVNYGSDNVVFAAMTYILAAAGYITSYTLRVRRVSLQSMHIPLLICLGILVLSFLLTDGMNGGVMPTLMEDRSKSLQFIFVWLAILHSFTLSSDAAVLFACVPCMTMIALVSTSNPDAEVQNAFLTFIGSATFLMVHENYLRTRTAVIVGRSPAGERRLFGGQLMLTVFCVVGALVLANVVAVPIRTVGQAVLPGAVISQITSGIIKPSNSSSSNVTVGERYSVDLATGPVSATSTPLLSVHCDRQLYWRGTTFDYYTLHSFESRVKPTYSWPLNDDASEVDFGQHQAIDPYAPRRPASSFNSSHFRTKPTEYDLSPRQMRGSRECRQKVTILGGNFTQLYGAATILEASTQFMTLNQSAGGSLLTNIPLVAGNEYEVVSCVANDDPEALRKAGTADVPPAISETYLQATPIGTPDNPRLRALAEEITRGQKTNYDKAVAIQREIASRCKYNLQAPAAPRDRDIVEYFLFESKQGYCDSFGAAMTILCRYAGIPARLASGFLTGDPDGKGNFTVKEKDKHIWAEVFFPHIGWVPFDATEGAEDITIYGKPNDVKSSGFMAWLLSHGWLPPLIGGIILLLLGYVAINELWDKIKPARIPVAAQFQRPASNAEIVALYTGAYAELARRGLIRPVGATPDEYARMVTTKTQVLLPEITGPWETLTTLHTRYRYGPEVADSQDVMAAQQAAAAVKRAAVKVKRGAFAEARA